ncbi:MAG: type II toxin-antitoxin system HipA family toxin [Desulfobacteraceae bacterium]|nr:MAG: type II toxin-antitoxin system HipA family toxin [Desulfobacteraceae bacterium]
MTSEKVGYQEAFVWIWLPGAMDPVVAGKLTLDGNRLTFNYGKSYLDRRDAIPIFEMELPLQPGILPLLPGLSMPGCIRDASPDAWGRRVIMNKKLGRIGVNADSARLDELTYLLESGSDRIGALDFQQSATEYIPRSAVNVPLDELLQSAERVEKGIPLTAELDQALWYGTSIGGARPKALIDGEKIKYIAKFSSSADVYNMIKAEFIAMRLARIAGIHAAAVSLARSSNKDVLIIERFDRIHTEHGWQRKCMVSALTMLGLDEMMARYAGYPDLAEIVRHKFTHAGATLKELFSRMVFNILCGNTDDHARNHAAFWDGRMLSLTPAYDICPQSRAGREASQAMLITSEKRLSRISACLEAAHHFLLSVEEATAIVEHQISAIAENWSAVCEEAGLAQTDRSLLWGRQFLNPFAFDDLTGGLDKLAKIAGTTRNRFVV